MIGVRGLGKAAAGLLAFALVLSGCGAAKAPDTIDKTCIVATKEGNIISHTVGIFDKEYYKLEDLRRMAQEEVAAYNTANQSGTAAPVRVERVEAVPDSAGKIVVTYGYDSAQTYQKYQEYQGNLGKTLFYGTVEEAVKAGYDFSRINQVMFDAAKEKSITSSMLTDAGTLKKHVLITNEKMTVYCPYKVAYVTENALVAEDGSVDTSWVETELSPVIILLSK